jgi:sterol desaturase/sphingolipid hydroxylase (fatty acid hydroxylase superfamily)
MILRWLWHLSYFYVTWGTFFAVAVITFVVLCIHNRTVFSLRRFIRHCVPFEAWTSKSVRMDVFLWGLAKVMTFRDLPLIGSSMAVAALLSRHLKQLFPNLTTIRPTAWMLAVAIACLLVFKEFVDYAIHYAQHRVPILWELHKVHHTALHLMPLTAKRGHPLEMFMQGAIVGVANGLAFGVCGFIFGLSLPELILSTGILGKMMTIGSLDTLRHSHFQMGFGWLDKVFISPHMHHIHHSRLTHHWDRNFGTNLSIFDWIFGTAYRPGKNEEIAYGIGDEEEERAHLTLSGALLGPLLKMWGMVVSTVVTFVRPGQRTHSGGDLNLLRGLDGTVSIDQHAEARVSHT